MGHLVTLFGQRKNKRIGDHSVQNNKAETDTDQHLTVIKRCSVLQVGQENVLLNRKMQNLIIMAD